MSNNRANKYVQANTIKARKMDIMEFKYVQSRGDAADIQRGRVLPFYDQFGMTRDAVAQEKWSRYHSLNPQEQYAVRSGAAPDPRDEVKEVGTSRRRQFSVVYENGCRRIVRTLTDAMYECIVKESVSKIYTGTEGGWMTRAEVLALV